MEPSLGHFSCVNMFILFVYLRNIPQNDMAREKSWREIRGAEKNGRNRARNEPIEKTQEP